MEELIATNEYQTPITKELMESLNKEIQDQFWEFITTVPYIRKLIAKDRPRAKDLPRDKSGKIIVDLTNPHILENVDYFRPTAIHYQKTGKLTNLRPNSNPNSEYGKWIREEIRRCYEGYVRPSDGEWVTGDMYFFLNYCPMLITQRVEGSKKGKRVWGFPEFWEGHYYKFHYIHQAREAGHHGAELAARSKGKSFTMAALLAKRFILGESADVNKAVNCMATAYQKEYLTKDGLLNKFQSYIDFCAQNTEFPSRRLKSSLQEMAWKMGYIDAETGTYMGTLNEVLGVSSKDDESKLRGKRGVLIAIEEFGSFPNLKGLYGTLRPSVEEGDYVYGMIYCQGTAGDKDSDFSGAQELMYNPIGYNIHPIDNIYDKEGQGRPKFSYFFPGYLSMAGYFDKNGNSDVTGALISILKRRFEVKYNSTDINAITKAISEIPVTPQEAIIRSTGSIFPVTELTARLNEIEANPAFYDDTYVGDLVMKDGEVCFEVSYDQPIRQFPTKDNKVKGALEIYEMPQKVQNKVPQGRYIVSLDNYENDESNTMSLGSLFVLDLWTDRIVAEYTGRPMFVDDLNEIARKVCIFFNAKLLYEAHPYSQVVKTPYGSKLWRDVSIGDTLFSPNGKTVKVIDVPVDTEMPIYKITLEDGREVMASDNHIWSVYKLNNTKEPILITTKEMLELGVKNKHNQHNFFIPNGGIVNYEKQEVPIDPYTLGLLIAEGCFVSQHCHNTVTQLSSNEDDMNFYKTIVPYKITRKDKGYNWNIHIENGRNLLDSIGLYGHKSYTKHIPALYLFNSVDTRMELLKGLMDGDGCANSKGAKIFITASKYLADDVMSLCRSLGINSRVRYSELKKGDKIYKYYRVTIYTEEIIFKLPRKVQNCHKYQVNSKGSKAKAYIYKTAIKSIEYSHREKGKCVTVDSEDGLYMIGDYIVTHNCNKKNTFSYFSKMNSLHLLADTPEYLKNKQLIKNIGYGNVSKGVNATVPIKNFGFTLIRDWLLKPVVVTKEENGEEVQYSVPNLYNLKGRALIQELIAFNPNINVDRIMSLVQLMLFREEKMILYQGNPQQQVRSSSDNLANDPFFKRNYDDRISKFSKKSSY